VGSPIDTIHEHLARLDLRILVVDPEESEPDTTRLLAAPVEFERFLDLVAPGGERDLDRLGWKLHVDAIDAAADEDRANWVLAIAIDIPRAGVGVLIRRLRRGSDAAESTGSVLVPGPEKVQ
jgi:hypothetical protein